MTALARRLRAGALYRGDSGTLVKVAAVGDPAPQGGTFHSIGPGSLNNRREIVFLARTANVLTSDLYVWRPGALALFARAGDPAPGGGTYAMLGTESFGFQDGSNIPTGPVPAINDRGAVAFRAITSGGSASRGVVLARTGCTAGPCAPAIPPRGAAPTRTSGPRT